MPIIQVANEDILLFDAMLCLNAVVALVYQVEEEVESESAEEQEGGEQTPDLLKNTMS